MINDVFAPVVKTLFIPEGNPGVREVKEIRAFPRVLQADGDAQEITVTGEMDLSISYVPINDIDDEIPWRTIQFTEKDDLGQCENEEQVIARLESALKEEQDEEGKNKDQWFKIDISVPFTLAIDTDGFSRDHIVKLDPCIHSCNWFLVGPKAIEFEAVLQLATQEEAREIEIKEEEPTIIQMKELTSKEENIREEQDLKEEDFREADSSEEADFSEGDLKKEDPCKEGFRVEEQEIIKEQKPVKEQVSLENQKLLEQKQEDKGKEQQFKVKPKIQAVIKPIKSEEEIGEDRHRFLMEKGYFQMKFYRVQLGEDLDAIADKFDIPRERISTYNSINEEEIRTGLLLSIPRK